MNLPKQEHFEDDYAYNSTALHELAHSTGHTNRLNRNLSGTFGFENYAFEELIAEISSCFMSADLQVKQDANHIDNHKAYVQSWIQTIMNKPDTLVKAIKEAEKTANYMEFKAELMLESVYKLSLDQSFEVKLQIDDKKKEKTVKTFDEIKKSVEYSKNNSSIKVSKNEKEFHINR